MFEKEMDQRLKDGKLPVYKGNPRNWQVLDESFQSETRKRAQMDINDSKVIQVLSEDSDIQRRKEDAMTSDAEEDFVQVPIRTKYYD
jgi:hypothetical protein